MSGEIPFNEETIKRSEDQFAASIVDTNEIHKDQEKPKEKKERKIGETLETAFDIKDQEPFVNEETARDIKLYDVAHILVFGDRFSHKTNYFNDSDTEKTELKNSDTMELNEILEYAPNDVTVIKLRQEMLRDLVSGSTGNDEKEKHKDFIEQIRRMTDELRNILDVHINYSLEKHGRDNLRGVESNIEELKEYINGNIDNLLNRFKKEISEISGNSKFLLELKDSIDQAIMFAQEFKNDIEKEGWIPRLEKLNELIELDQQDEIPENYHRPFKNQSEYKNFLSKIYAEKRNGFNSFLSILSNLDKLLMCSQVIDERGLNEVEISDNGVLEFAEGKSPYLMADSHIKEVVPFDINVTKEKPINIVTGDNATGKSKFVDAIIANSVMAQSMGYAMAKGGSYSPKKELAYLHSLNVKVDETQWSRGQKEMKALAEIVDNLKENNLIVMDEFLTSTDSVGAISIVLAVLEQNGEKGGISFLTIHSRDLEKVKDRGIAPMVKFLRAKEGLKGKKTYQWEEGIGRANPLKLAKESGLPDSIIKRAAKIQSQLEKN